MLRIGFYLILFPQLNSWRIVIELPAIVHPDDIGIIFRRSRGILPHTPAENCKPDAFAGR